jgi:phage tail P2-like protein
MTGTISLLPPNSTQLERNLARVGAEIESNDTTLIVKVTRADVAPAAFLPYLAWEVSVDRWSDSWTDDVKRKVIQESFYVHKRKGTIASLRRVVEPFGYLLDVVEWFEEDPPAQRGTFRLDIGVTDQGITDVTYAELERLIADTKPLSRHMVGLSITVLVRGNVYIGAASYTGETTTVYPPKAENIEVHGNLDSIGAVHLIDTVIVRPL